MGGMNLGGDRGAKGKKKGLRRPKRRINVLIDMTPMVDIAFLLLIFYMVSTIFAEPQAMEINLPPSKEDDIRTKESLVLTLRVAPDDRLYWNMAQDAPEPIEMSGIVKLFKDKVLEVPGMITLVKINKKAHYSRMVDILDRIEIVEYQFKQADPDYSYTFSLAPWTRLDTKTLARAAEASASEASEASEEEGTTP